jgi:sec-independent protein translocase protein TatC
MTLFEHLGELRNRLVKAVLAVAIGGVIGFIAYDRIFDLLIEPYRAICEQADNQLLEGCDLLVTDPLEGFSIRLKISGYTGLALAMPVVLWQVWRFVTPGLYPNEKRYAVPFVASAVVLFLSGAAIAFWTMPKALEFLTQIGGDNLVAAFSPSSYFQLIVYMMLAFGIGFEFPILLVFLELAGVLTPTILRRWRRYAVVIIAAVVAVATPSGDPISMLALTIPMILFYEAAIIFGRLLERRRATAAAPAT